MKYSKLVRDTIPAIIRQSGREPVFHIADEEEYWEKLKEKLQEEADEFVKAPSLEEMADIVEVLNAICTHHGWKSDELISIRKKKAAERGGFRERIILDES